MNGDIARSLSYSIQSWRSLDAVLVFTFPGQGSQRPGMGRDWANHPSWELVSDVSDICSRNVAHLLLDATEEELRATRNSQLATFTMSMVILDAIERLGLAPGAVAGHSLGEYTALIASGALGFDEGVRLVSERGESMQAAAEQNPGTMAALLGITEANAEASCHIAGGDVWIANYNAPDQFVVAGGIEEVRRAGEAALSLGARKVVNLQVSGAFHTPFMLPARERLSKALESTTFSDPEIPVVANVDANVHRAGSDWPVLLAAQLSSPVRWRQTLAALDAMGARAVVEVGPGGVLVGLARRALGDARALVVANPEDLDFLVQVLADGSPLQAYVGGHAGEGAHISERVVIAPSSGAFEAGSELSVGSSVNVGDSVGTVGGEEARSPFSGTLMGILVMDGERVNAGQPVAWLTVGEVDS